MSEHGAPPAATTPPAEPPIERKLRTLWMVFAAILGAITAYTLWRYTQRGSRELPTLLNMSGLLVLALANALTRRTSRARIVMVAVALALVAASMVMLFRR